MVTCAHQYGLEEDDLQQIQNILSLFSHIEEVTLFGSQAKRDYKRGSDIDLCYYKLKNIALKEHIDRYGISIYKRKV